MSDSEHEHDEFRYPTVRTRRSEEDEDTQEDLRSHPRGRPWQNLPSVLQHGPWKRHKKAHE